METRKEEVALTGNDTWSEFDNRADIYEVTNTQSHTPRDPSITLQREKTSVRLASQGILSGFVLVNTDTEVRISYPVPAVAQRRILMSVQPTLFEPGVPMVTLLLPAAMCT
ncbi:hypothetical protein PBY51_016838 [Eleginops maclovinus]|uniref:Uncharacterized protein n=1 Tax=Eleginops maclovinus TaxID=56733 RepID=A0AAN7WR29_ELEMC|nr:hypothetical protein PBY51_016838 [Eleginops maclovinus]